MTTDSLLDITEAERAFREQFVSWNLAELSYVDIRAYLEEKDMVLVPMASTEQHGPHLPLYCDTITAIEISARVSRLIGVLTRRRSGPAIHRNTCTVPVRVGHHHCPLDDVACPDGRRCAKPHPPWVQPDRLRERSWLEHQGGRPGPPQTALRDRRSDRIGQALYGAVRRRGRGDLREPARGDPRLALEWVGDLPSVLRGTGDLVRNGQGRSTPPRLSPTSSPNSFRKFDGAPDVELPRATPISTFPWITSSPRPGSSATRCAPTKEKGEESFKRYSEHVAREVCSSSCRCRSRSRTESSSTGSCDGRSRVDHRHRPGLRPAARAPYQRQREPG